MPHVRIVTPSAEELRAAHEMFMENEPRARDYDNAIAAVVEGIAENSHKKIARSLAGFLKSWNRMYYRFRPLETENLAARIGDLVQPRFCELLAFRKRSILSVTEEDRSPVERTHGAFEEVLHPVGAAKALHLLAPDFFPLWDIWIGLAYGAGIGPPGTNGSTYFRFMKLFKEQVQQLRDTLPSGANPLKLIDEFNYCRHTKHWL